VAGLLDERVVDDGVVGAGIEGGEDAPDHGAEDIDGDVLAKTLDER